MSRAKLERLSFLNDVDQAQVAKHHGQRNRLRSHCNVVDRLAVQLDVADARPRPPSLDQPSATAGFSKQTAKRAVNSPLNTVALLAVSPSYRRSKCRSLPSTGAAVIDWIAAISSRRDRATGRTDSRRYR